jgi:hypothetical protein
MADGAKDPKGPLPHGPSPLGPTAPRTPPPPVTEDPFGSMIPPAAAFDEDPSTHKAQLFKISIYSAPDLKAAFVPPGLSPGGTRDVLNTMLDSVAVPTSACQVNESASDVGEFAGALRQLTSRGGDNGTIREDVNWAKKNRNTIRTIKSALQLRERQRLLINDQTNLLSVMRGTIESILLMEGWSPARAAAWASNGFLTRIATDTLRYYADLHGSLLSNTMETGGWEMTKQALEHWVRLLDNARMPQQTRLQSMCALYLVLRDGAREHWHSRELMHQQTVEVWKLTQPTAVGGEICPKCRTSLHGGLCPWKNKTDTEAQNRGRLALAELGDR